MSLCNVIYLRKVLYQNNARKLMRQIILKLLFIPALLTMVFAVAFAPDTVTAQGLVPCSGSECNFCHFVTLANSVIAWLIGILALVFGVMVFIAGFGLVTSGGNDSKLTDAKKSLTNALIGLIIVLAAWLIVDTLIKLTLPNGETDIGPWNQISCEGGQITSSSRPPGATGGGGAGAGTPVVPQGIDGDGVCPVTPLTPITDAAALILEGGNRAVWQNGANSPIARCSYAFIARLGRGSINSAYRPPAYQTHLYEIVTKARALNQTTDTDCTALRAQITSELNNHELTADQAVAQSNSRHSAGTAVDIGGIGNYGAVASIASEYCLTWRDYPNDAVHYDFNPGGNCPCRL